MTLQGVGGAGDNLQRARAPPTSNGQPAGLTRDTQLYSVASARPLLVRAGCEKDTPTVGHLVPGAAVRVIEFGASKDGTRRAHVAPLSHEEELLGLGSSKSAASVASASASSAALPSHGPAAAPAAHAAHAAHATSLAPTAPGKRPAILPKAARAKDGASTPPSATPRVGVEATHEPPDVKTAHHAGKAAAAPHGASAGQAAASGSGGSGPPAGSGDKSAGTSREHTMRASKMLVVREGVELHSAEVARLHAGTLVHVLEHLYLPDGARRAHIRCDHPEVQGWVTSLRDGRAQLEPASTVAIARAAGASPPNTSRGGSLAAAAHSAADESGGGSKSKQEAQTPAAAAAAVANTAAEAARVARARAEEAEAAAAAALSAATALDPAFAATTQHAQPAQDDATRGAAAAAAVDAVKQAAAKAETMSKQAAKAAATQKGVDVVQASIRRALKASAVRVVDLFRDWDDDNSGSISKKEFRTALGALKIDGSRHDYEALFDAWVSLYAYAPPPPSRTA